ncbi:hypothetical protein A4G99_19155 [Haladaptatus sp. R4]|nr:hypothetical protein A4G99_19155 [Haladaptatus sp. R4]
MSEYCGFEITATVPILFLNNIVLKLLLLHLDPMELWQLIKEILIEKRYTKLKRLMLSVLEIPSLVALFIE